MLLFYLSQCVKAGLAVVSGDGAVCAPAGRQAVTRFDGDGRASAIRARAQRREVRPNIWASLRSESGLPAFALSRYAAIAA
jgi:hypothetical protein